jgi:hypothetical protein
VNERSFRSVGSAPPNVPRGRKKCVIQKSRNIHTGEIQYKIAKQPKRLIRFKQDPKLIVKGPGSVPPTPPNPELVRKKEELEQLFFRLRGREIIDPDARQLLEAADGNLDRLLARLRELLRDGSYCYIKDFQSLVGTVWQLHWIR